jgi:uncharacterized protein YodC (DUF2158 family)
MEQKFQAGEQVVHKSDKDHPMTVVRYPNAGQVICRWKVKGRFQTREFMEAEVEKWVPPPPDLGPFVFNPNPPRY